MLELWYGYSHMKAVRADTTADTFLNDRVLQIEEAMADPDLALKKRRLYLRFQYAVADPDLYSMIITFLETPSFSSALSAGLVDKIERVRKPGLGGPGPVKERAAAEGKADEATAVGAGEAVEPGKMEEPAGGVGGAGSAGGKPEEPVGVAGPAGAVEAGGPAGTVDAARKRNFHAKTFFIAAELHFELKSKVEEFKSFSIDKKAAFVKKQFHTDKLPGTFYELKGYSYKPVMLGDNMSRKGQLKPFFRQIVENPKVFGKAVAQRAQKILADYFN